MSLITHFNTLQSTLFPLPIHPIYLPYPPLDVLGSIRLSIFITQFTRARNGVNDDDGLEEELRRRPAFGQEGFGIMMMIFGGETFLAALSQQTPSWLLSPSLPILFLSAHYILSRTRLSRHIPTKPSFLVELPLSLFDALGRSLVLTTFSIDGLIPSPVPEVMVMGATGMLETIPKTMATKSYPGLYQLLLTPLINTVPFASLTFALDMYSSSGWSLSTPGELKKGGWRTVDVWSPVLVGWIYVWLTGIWGGVEGVAYQDRYEIGKGQGREKGDNGYGWYDSLRNGIIQVLVRILGPSINPYIQSLLPPSSHDFFFLSSQIGAGTWTRPEARGLCGLLIAFLFACRTIWGFGGWEGWYVERFESQSGRTGVDDFKVGKKKAKTRGSERVKARSEKGEGREEEEVKIIGKELNEKSSVGEVKKRKKAKVKIGEAKNSSLSGREL